MNNQNLMISRTPGQAGAAQYAEPGAGTAAPDEWVGAWQSGDGLMRRDAVPVPPQEPVPQPAEDGPAPEKRIGVEAAASEAALAKKTAALKARTAQAAKDAARSASKSSGTPAVRAAPAVKSAPAAKPAASAAKTPPSAKPAAAGPAPGSVKTARSPDELCGLYTGMFRDTLGLELSTSICFENMRRICEADTRDPAKTLFFLENTYRVSTVLYLAGNLPILVVASILAEKNRKNILKYVTSEVENGAKPYQELLDLRTRRWARKYEHMAVNDAMTVTPGATQMTPELAAQAAALLRGICTKLKKFDKEMSGIVAKFDDATRNDIVYIYSNWWYLLQGFENVPEMRSYIMAITDDTRRNLKL